MSTTTMTTFVDLLVFVHLNGHPRVYDARVVAERAADFAGRSTRLAWRRTASVERQVPSLASGQARHYRATTGSPIPVWPSHSSSGVVFGSKVHLFRVSFAKTARRAALFALASLYRQPTGLRSTWLASHPLWSRQTSRASVANYDSNFACLLLSFWAQRPKRANSSFTMNELCVSIEFACSRF